jgi:hypothetical protein
VKVLEIRRIAKTKGVVPGRMKKTELIRAIQRAEGNYECFETAVEGHCSQAECAWREDCLPTAH